MHKPFCGVCLQILAARLSQSGLASPSSGNIKRKMPQSNFTLKLLWRPHERTPAAKAQAQFICAVKRRSRRGLKINRL
jgi:hypothetical protein